MILDHDLATPTTNDNQVLDTDNDDNDEVKWINFERNDNQNDGDNNNAASADKHTRVTNKTLPNCTEFVTPIDGELLV